MKSKHYKLFKNENKFYVHRPGKNETIAETLVFKYLSKQTNVHSTLPQKQSKLTWLLGSEHAKQTGIISSTCNIPI